MGAFDMATRVLALDFGASGARAMRAELDPHGKLSVTTLHRWENVPVTVDGRMCWDMEALFREVRTALRLSATAGGVDSIGIDTWGVDFGLLDERGTLIEQPVHYRDARTAGILKTVYERISPERLFQCTGVQTMEINTAFQLLALRIGRPEVFGRAKTLLLMPDLFAYLLTGETGAEYSIASTTQLLDCGTGQWSREICGALGIPQELLPPVSAAGTQRGILLPELAKESGLGAVPVIAVAAHDTASAVAAAPCEAENAAFLSCGTWSLLGTVLERPVCTRAARVLQMANEGGYGGKITYLKNLTGLWLVQEARRQWAREGHKYSFADLDALATEARTEARFDTQAAALTAPGDMPGRIAALCRANGRRAPDTPGEFVRSIYESLADTYAQTLAELRETTGRAITEIHLLGGGARGNLLPRLTANRTGCKVSAGPVEATVLGNLGVQLIALGALDGLSAAHAAIGTQEAVRIYEPEES